MNEYTHISQCGQYQVIPVNARYEQVVPLAGGIPSPPPTVEPESPSRGFAGIAIVALLAALALAVLTGGDGESSELVQLRRENQLLKQRIDQLEYTLMGIYSAQ